MNKALFLTALLGIVATTSALKCYKCIYLEFDTGFMTDEMVQDMLDKEYEQSGDYGFDCKSSPSNFSEETCVAGERCMTFTGTAQTTLDGNTWTVGVTARGCEDPTIRGGGGTCEDNTNRANNDGASLIGQFAPPMSNEKGRACKCATNNCHASDTAHSLTTCYTCHYFQVAQDARKPAQITYDDIVFEDHTPQCKDDLEGSDVAHDGCDYGSQCVTVAGSVHMDIFQEERREYEYIFRQCADYDAYTFSSSCDSDDDVEYFARRQLQAMDDDAAEERWGVGSEVMAEACSCTGYRCNNEDESLSGASGISAALGLVALLAMGAKALL